jgi:hypothetical protein
MRLLMLATAAAILLTGSMAPPVHAEDTTVIKKDDGFAPSKTIIKKDEPTTDKKVIIKKED